MEQLPQYAQLVEEVEQQINKSVTYVSYHSNLPFKDCPAYETLKNLVGAQKLDAVLYLAKRVKTIEANLKPEQRDPEDLKIYYISCNLLYTLLRTRIDFPQGFSFRELFNICRNDSMNLSLRPFSALISHIEKQVKKYGLDESLQANIQSILDFPELSRYTTGLNSTTDTGKLVKKLQALLMEHKAPTEATPPYLLGDDKFGSLVSKDLSTLPPAQQSQWHALFHHLSTASGGKPNAKFLATAEQRIEAIGAEPFRASVVQWLTAAANFSWDSGIYTYIQRHSTLLKGLLWTMHRFQDEHTLQVIALFTEKSFQNASWASSMAVGVGNAGLYTLANATGLEGISHLSRLKLRVKNKSAQTQIQKYLEEQAQKRGSKPAQIEEMAVSDYGLVEGVRTELFGDYQLVLDLTGGGESDLQWLTSDGTPQKSAPAFVKADETLGAKFKTMQGLAKQAKQASSTQRDRIDRLYVENLSWSMADFETYYLLHGLVCTLTRKLIWSLDGQPALFVAGQWQDESGAVVNTGAQTQVRLWHPIDSSAETILAWRDRLDVLQIQQPFKQAYREIYLLTDAEINTRIYSNRMAAHILKQHQFNSLAALRGWKYSFLGVHNAGSNGEIAKKRLPEQGLTAQFCINEIIDDAGNANESGIWNYVATDQVRFCDGNNEAVPLTDIPPIVFSEIMRDVDLFVGVASVGNDPQWRDGGPAELQNYHDYWQGYSFGDLSEVAKTRKSVLERLLPRLKIRNVAKIDGKFLVVQGKRHAYKIHIGSGNILISPNDRYLCIVPGRDKDKNVDSLFLPFEGDKGLSIVLSKAFLLAEDDKIKDPTILSQL